MCWILLVGLLVVGARGGSGASSGGNGASVTGEVQAGGAVLFSFQDSIGSMWC